MPEKDRHHRRDGARSAPLIRSWKVRMIEHGGRRYRLFENGDAALVCGGIGAEAARRATEAVIREVSPARVISVGFAGALDGSLEVGQVLEPRTVINAADGVADRRRIGRGNPGEFRNRGRQGAEGSTPQSLWRDCGGHGSGGRGARSRGAWSGVRGFESHFRRRRFQPAGDGTICGGRREVSLCQVCASCGAAPVALEDYDCLGAEQLPRQAEALCSALASYLERPGVR